MDNNMSNIINDVQKMVDNGNIPDDIKKILNNMNANSSNVKNSNNSAESVDINSILNNIPPETINNFKNIFNSSQSTNSASNNENSMPNIDMNTILKMKSAIEKMNQKDDPRANLLNSLKPYLRDSKKNKVDQYVNLLNMSKIADIMNNKDQSQNNSQK